MASDTHMRPKVTITIILIGITALALAAPGSCQRQAEPTQWNLLWISIDDLKADHLGAAGYKRDLTPALDRLADSGVRFEHCVSQAPWSLPSYASMLTSRYPSELVLNQAYLSHLRAETADDRSLDPARLPAMNILWYSRLNPDAPLLAEVLQKHGFATAAWINNAWLKPDTYGLERGFGYYYDGLADHTPYTPADQTVKLAADWIRINSSQRWFVFIHLMDPHRPYQPHPESDFGPRSLDRYDAEVAFTDRAVGDLLAQLKASGLNDRTVVVVNADHGEGIYPEESRFVGHGGGVLPEIVLVPLIIRWPGGPRGRVITALGQNLDIMPTALSLLEVPAPAGMRGRSLLNDIAAKAKVSPDPAFTMATLAGPEQISVMVQGGRPDELYQGVAIPAYQQARASSYDPLAGWSPGAPEEAVTRVMTLLQNFTAETDHTLSSAPAQPVPALDDQTRKALEGLGYINQ